MSIDSNLHIWNAIPFLKISGSSTIFILVGIRTVCKNILFCENFCSDRNFIKYKYDHDHATHILQFILKYTIHDTNEGELKHSFASFY